jgi:roadblock/LC7 domain-containing protein
MPAIQAPVAVREEFPHMVNLTNLMNLKGAISAAECKPDGGHISYIINGDQTHDLDKMTERLCAINTLMITTVESFDRVGEMTWRPFRGWATAAGDYTVFVASPIILIVETDKADFNEIFGILSEETRITPKAA